MPSKELRGKLVEPNDLRRCQETPESSRYPYISFIMLVSGNQKSAVSFIFSETAMQNFAIESEPAANPDFRHTLVNP